MKIKSQRDFWSGLMFIVVGIGFAWGATNYSFGNSARPGPGYFPFGLGIILAILGAVVLFKALTVEVEGGDKVGAFAWRPLLIILASIALFGVLLPWLGMAIALPILVFTSSAAGDEFHWRDALINSAILTVGSWAIFIKGLSLTIPLWPTFMQTAAQ
ncbi:MAG: tripartite tricarboxylate transporter TctB family protein [Proteobacteria bacterium]|nr:tripartite tricarboxylate transporter TctB family protein [Pseudomonadota bacterium]